MRNYVGYGKATQSFHASTNNFATIVAICTFKTFNKLECKPMPNVMVALPNIGGALCSTLQSLADAHY